MKEIKLTQNKVALIDDEDFEKLNNFKWHVHKKRNKYYALRGVCIKGKSEVIRMHRELLSAPKGMQVDHINGNGLDNRRGNLRLCTHQQNRFNQKESQKNNKLRIKGVHWDKKAKKFTSQIKINGKVINLGFYNVLGDADSAYRKAEEKYFGVFARNREVSCVEKKQD